MGGKAQPQYAAEEMLANSLDDEQFLKQAAETIQVNAHGYLEIGLPFRNRKPRLPNNRALVYARTDSALKKLKRKSNETMLKHCLDKMNSNLSSIPPKFEKVPEYEVSPRTGEAF